MTILLLAAMEIEEQALLADRPFLPVQTVHSALGIAYRSLTQGDKTFLVARAGVGPVNAGLTLAFIAERVALDGVLLLGVGGALAPELVLGDVVVAEAVVQHDSFISGKHRRELMAAGELYLSAETKVDPVIATDPGLTDWVSGGFAAGECRSGAILSGNEFVGNTERKLTIAAHHARALLVDMEAAGVAQVARKLRLPFAVAKTVADVLHPPDSVSRDYRRALEKAAQHAGQVLHRLLER